MQPRACRYCHREFTSFWAMVRHALLMPWVCPGW